MICTCIVINCWHPKGECDEPPTYRGGICSTCRYHHSNPFRTCPLCGRTEKWEDMVGGVCLACADGIADARRASINVKENES